MKIAQMVYENGKWELKNGEKLDKTDLVFVFGSTEVLKQKKPIQELKQELNCDWMLGCTTSGNIFDTEIIDDSIVATAVKFDKTKVFGAIENIESPEESFKAGESLGAKIPKDGLKHVFVLSDGLNVNGSKLVKGLLKGLPEEVKITGGLAGDDDRFKETYIVWNGEIKEKAIGAIGFYGDIKIGYGSFGGWDPFGPERVITKVKGNVLYELDSQPALELYKKYLGEHAKQLPASGLLFPLSVRMGDEEVVRTILAINEEEQSITFAGDLPEGAHVRFMKANFDRLIEGAEKAAEINADILEHNSPELAILITCVGRRLILKQRTEEEVEAVQEIFGEDTIITGYYSYGEISPFVKDGICRLHNQTMTITTFLENF